MGSSGRQHSTDARLAEAHRALLPLSNNSIRTDKDFETTQKVVQKCLKGSTLTFKIHESRLKSVLGLVVFVLFFFVVVVVRGETRV